MRVIDFVLTCLRVRRATTKGFAATLAIMLVAGCAGNRTATGPVFFPPPPDPPRVQFLIGLSSSKDLDTDEKFSLFQLGQRADAEVITLAKPAGVAVHGAKVYVSDGAGKVTIIDFIQKRFSSLKGNFGAGKLKRPAGLAFSPEGNLFVADVQRKEVLMYDPDGNFLQAIGKDLNIKPVAVAADSDNVYILDMTNSVVKVLDRKTWGMVREIGRGSNKDVVLAVPYSMVLDSEGYLHITNILSGKVMKFDRDGHLVHSFGELGDAFGQFSRPRGIETDREGITYVVDGAFQNVQMFNDKGRLLMFFGDPGLQAGSLNMPTDVAVGYEGLEYFQKLADPSFVLEKLIFVTSQFGEAKLSVYGFGHKKGTVALPAEGEPQKKAPEQK